jgi:hypothetical protein
MCKVTYPRRVYPPEVWSRGHRSSAIYERLYPSFPKDGIIVPPNC